MRTVGQRGVGKKLAKIETQKTHKKRRVWLGAYKKLPKTKNDCRDYPKSPSNIPSNQMDFFRSNGMKNRIDE